MLEFRWSRWRCASMEVCGCAGWMVWVHTEWHLTHTLVIISNTRWLPWYWTEIFPLFYWLLPFCFSPQITKTVETNKSSINTYMFPISMLIFTYVDFRYGISAPTSKVRFIGCKLLGFISNNCLCFCFPVQENHKKLHFKRLS